ncbi:hypothetical protein OEA41_002566 [Lepraria neglecta]|uniref:Fungal N-terminal domain-containing protein n=1 Tax=Lepraria neglecta TaxID=209136 RepID=A0AAE0DMC6_9LECA|nr:hypothetical protein OEA41_002566 [Lepraria neglecta]
MVGAVVDIAGKYKDAWLQIESFGREVGILGKILDQLNRLIIKDESHMNAGARTLTSEIVDECIYMFSQLDDFNTNLYRGPDPSASLTVRWNAKWLFKISELEFLRARVDSMKIDILLMMILQSIHSGESEACIRRLQNLEHEVMIYDAQGLESQSRGTSILSANTVAPAKSTWDSHFDAYGWIPFGNDKSYNNQDGHVAARGIQEQYGQIAELADDFLLQDLDRLSGEERRKRLYIEF